MQETELPNVVTPCQKNPRIFYSPDLIDQKRAKEMCVICPFRTACLAKAFRIDAQGGVWGGFDDVERGFYAKLYGTDIGKRVKPLPVSIVRRLEANRVMKTGPDAVLADVTA